MKSRGVADSIPPPPPEVRESHEPESASRFLDAFSLV
jgi:hypothetical protein